MPITATSVLLDQDEVASLIESRLKENATHFDRVEFDQEKIHLIFNYYDLIVAIAYPKTVEGVHKPPIVFGHPQAYEIPHSILQTVTFWCLSILDKYNGTNELLSQFDFDLHSHWHCDESKTAHILMGVIKFRSIKMESLKAIVELMQSFRNASSNEEIMTLLGPLSFEKTKALKRKDLVGWLNSNFAENIIWLLYQSNSTKQKFMHLFADLYADISISYMDSIPGWTMDRHHPTIKQEIIEIFPGRELEFKKIPCPAQPDGYSCGPRTALNTVFYAIDGKPPQYKYTSEDLVKHAISVLGISDSKNLPEQKRQMGKSVILSTQPQNRYQKLPVYENKLFSSYTLLGCLFAIGLSILLNYLLGSSATVVVGGLGGMLGISLIAVIFFEMVKWLVRWMLARNQRLEDLRFQKEITPLSSTVIEQPLSSRMPNKEKILIPATVDKSAVSSEEPSSNFFGL